MEDAEPIRVTIFEPSPILRRGLKQTLESEPDMQVVGDFGVGAHAASDVALLLPDVVLVSVNLPDISGLEVCTQVLEAVPGIRVVMMTPEITADGLVSTIIAGAAAYFPKDGPELDLVRTVRSNANGEMLLIREVAELLLRPVPNSRRAVDVSRLTQREKQVLFLAAQGLDNADIGKRLSLSPHTIRNHISSLLHKLNIGNRAELGVFAVVARMFSVPDRPDR